MRFVIMLIGATLAACSSTGARREPCWIPPPADDAALTATTAESLSERIARRSTHEPQPPPHSAELSACTRAPPEPARETDIDDRDPARLEPVMKKVDQRP